jgi:hypothetical protein
MEASGNSLAVACNVGYYLEGGLCFGVFRGVVGVTGRMGFVEY